MKAFRTQSAPSTLSRTLAICPSVIWAFFLVLNVNARQLGYAPDRVLLKLKADVSETDAHTIITSQEAVEAQVIPHIGVRVLRVAPSKLAKTLDALSHNPKVEFAEPDAIIEPDFTPNDPYFSSEWHLQTIAAPAAWDVTLGSANVIIAILDTGVDGTHPDLSPKLVAGWNTYDNNSNTSDVNGHGTWVAGTAGAGSNNGQGVAAVGFNCMLMPIRISDTTGMAYASTIASGLTWAADNGARVANISYEVTGVSSIDSAAQYFDSKGGVVTVSAGNYSTVLTIPDDPYVLTVSATDSTDAIASFSNTGTPIDLAAPGVGIYTTTVGGGYGSATGTSFSAPVVAGVAALVLSVNPSLSGSQLRQVLEQSADDLGAPGWDPLYGYGRVNAQKAVNLAVSMKQTIDTTPPTVSIASPGNGSVLAGTTTVQINASDDVSVASVTLSLDGTVVATMTTSPYNWSWNTTTAANGTHTLTATAKDPAGNTSQASVSVTVNNASAVDTTPPTITIVAPANGTTISRTVSVTVNASDDVAVTKVQLFVDNLLVSTSTSAPFTTSWNPRKAATGAHQLQCRAYDAAGNVGYSQIVTVYK